MSKQPTPATGPINVFVRDWKAIPGHLKKTIGGVQHILTCGRYREVHILYPSPIFSRMMV